MGISREEAESLAATISSVDADDPENFFAKVAESLSEAGLQSLCGIPAVRVTWDSLSVVVGATTAERSLPSLPNIALLFLRALVCQHPRQREQDLKILNNLSGSLEPGRLTLLLGPPSCGKSTMLRALAGRLGRTEHTGTVQYNGHDVSSFCVARSAAFVAQTDSHIANLTSRETVAFAYDAQETPRSSFFKPSKVIQSSVGQNCATCAQASTTLEAVTSLPNNASLASMSQEELADVIREVLDGSGRPDLFIYLFGLLRCKDTSVGTHEMRGISGGERKRLSTVEMLAGAQRVLVLDEISTGLDAATLFSIIKWLRAITHHLRMTVIISLLQPPPETYALFDDVMVFKLGNVVYHGPTDNAVGFMRDCGFALPPRKDVPSFLQEVLTVRGQIAYATKDLRAKLDMPKKVADVDDVTLADMDLFVPLSEFSERSQTMHAAHALETQQDNVKNGPGEGALIPKAERHALTFFEQFHVLLMRQLKMYMRDPSQLLARFTQSAIIGALIGGLWWQQDVSLVDFRTLISGCYMCVNFMASASSSQLGFSMDNRGVWFKQREAGLYGATAYAWVMALVEIPLTIFDCSIFSVIVYFMIGFTTDSAVYFFLWLGNMICLALAVSGMYALLGSAMQSPPAAQGVGSFLSLMLSINSGFVILRSSIPPWVIAFYWVSPFSFTVRAMVVNEFTSPRWDIPSPQPDVTSGALALESLDFYTDRKWIWIAMVYNLGLYVVLTQCAAIFYAVSKPRTGKAIIRCKEDIKEAIQYAMKLMEGVQAKVGDAASAAAAREKVRDNILDGGAPEEEELQNSPDSHAGSDDLAGSNSHSYRGGLARRASARRSALQVGSSLDFTPITVCWRQLSYYVTVAKHLMGESAENVMPEDHQDKSIAGKKRLLHDITGYLEPGQLTALMGVSGAGKSTLMDVLTGRKSQGVLSGAVTVNGHPEAQDTWARVVGYVEQDDILSAALTVEESLQFSAGLRLGEQVSAGTRAAYIVEVLMVTELLRLKGDLVGEPGESGQSGLAVEARRRLSIAVELVANPSVIFMDEPTSGLDAGSATTVMQAVHNVASNGRTVMVTIHQPSIEIFGAFDRLVLLAPGGKPIFNGNLGAHSKELIDYFQAIPGIPALPQDYNPATWMLEITVAKAKMRFCCDTEQDFPALYRDSEQFKSTSQRAHELINTMARSQQPLALDSKYAVSFWRQTVMVTWRMSVMYWRYPSYTVTRLLVSIFTALILGLTWWQDGSIPQDRPALLGDVQNIIGTIYSGVAFMGVTNMLAGMPAFIAERKVMYRERASAMYSASPFGIAAGIVELPYILTQTLIFVPISYFMIGFRVAWDPIAMFFIVFTEATMLYTYLGQAFAFLMPDQSLALMLGGLVHFLWNMFNGYLVPRPSMAKVWTWFNYMSPSTYVISSLGASQIGTSQQKMVVAGLAQFKECISTNLEACPTVAEYVEQYFDFDYEFRWWAALILFAYVMVFRVAAMLIIHYIKHERR